MDGTNTVTGRVVNMTLFFVSVEDAEGNRVTVPNNIVLQRAVINQTRKQEAKIMLERMRDRLKFHLEQLVMRGAQYRLLVIAAAIGLVSVAAGTLVMEIAGGFDEPGEAIWWAFLRLTDPGYLGDDEGVVRRTISTAVTVAGYVLFMGALIAILTQWLNQTMAKLERGLTPIVQNDHLLILGWTNRTASIVRELLLSQGRVQRFLRRRGARRLRVVILAEEAGVELVQELRERLGELWEPRQIVLRSGTPLRIEHLRRVDYTHAAAILIPGADFSESGTEAVDAQTIKTLLSMSHYSRVDELEELPLIVAEIFDERKVDVARHSYHGNLELLASDAFVSRLIAQNLRHRGLSQVFDELLMGDNGNEIYIRECPQLAGRPFRELDGAFPRAILLGVTRPDRKSFEPILNPPDDSAVEPGDRLVLLSRSYEDSAPMEAFAGRPLEGDPRVKRILETPRGRRILILGWSHKVPALLRELSGYESESFAVTVCSLVPADMRQEQLSRFGIDLERLQLRQIEGDYTLPAELLRLKPEAYDNIMLMASERMETGEEADARSILACLLFDEFLPSKEPGPEILVELMDPENLPLFERQSEEILVSPMILSHMLAQVALRRELRAVFDVLFGPGGAEIFFRKARDYGVTGREVNFEDLQEMVAGCGEIALGLRLAKGQQGLRGGVQLNPDRALTWNLGEEDELVVLSTYE